jgi:hypothetical protein
MRKQAGFSTKEVHTFINNFLQPQRLRVFEMPLSGLNESLFSH